jgi:DNA-binding IclR family transcriptional regulator
MSTAERSRRTGSLTLKRGLRVLRALAEHPDGLSVTMLAAEIGTHRAGIYRLLGPLLDQGLVVRDQDRYLLGLGLIELASNVRPRLQEVAAPELRRLADDLAATTALTIRDGEEAVVAAVTEPRHTDAHITYRAGLRHALDQAASGIAILAALPPRAGERDAISHARAAGWAVSTGELLPGVTGVGVPIVVSGREPEASISAVWLGERDAEPIAQDVLRSAGRIAAALA